MGIKRYYAKSDNTITNAFMENLTTRGSGSNMGAADILEVFSIFGQADSTSSEKSRALLEFDCTASSNSIKSDRTDGVLPASGSVSFYLRLFNAPHGQTLPKNYTMDVSAISGTWNEGTGLDMEGYKDIGASNWTNAVGTNVAATSTATITVFANMDAGETLTLISTDGTTVVATAHATTTTTNDTNTPTFRVLTDAPTTAANLKTCIDANSKFTASHTTGETTVTITQATAGRAGNTVATVSSISSVGMTVTSPFSGGDGAWVNTGGDYFSDTSSSFSASFDGGTEDIELDITTLVEQWVNSAGNVLGSKEDEGVGVFISNVYEAASRSYYTKKFFARGTEFHFKKPCIEARWDSSVQDDRGGFYYSSSLATSEENLNSIYLYNYFRGRLRNIPGIGTDTIRVSFFSGSATDTAPFGSALTLVADGTHVLAASPTVVTGTYVSTGIYKARVAINAATTPLSTVYDVWFSGSDAHTDATTATQYFTGSVTPKIQYASAVAPNEEYVISIKNLKNVYRSDETARLRVYTRQKDWSPTIYSKAVATPEVQIVESGSYEIYRVADDLKVVPYGTGSNYHTLMSYDASGSYFDFDMEMLESGYMYGIKFAFYNEDVGAWVEQPDNFKFRVESRQS